MLTTSALRSSPVMKAASATAALQLLWLSAFATPEVCAAYSPANTFGPERS